MATGDTVVTSNDVAHAWAMALLHLDGCSRREASPFMVTISTGDGVAEDSAIRAIADKRLAEHSESLVGTVASTIFPRSIWRTDQPATELYARYERIWPLVRKHRANAHGTYFRRFTSFGDGPTPVNQLNHIIETWKRGNHRRSALQLAVFDPTHDHTHQRQRGFPCLHQVALVPDGDQLSLTAFYATQMIFEKGYGNYLGLAYLGEFMAQEMGLRLASVTCIAAVAKFTQVSGLRKSERDALCAELDEAVGGGGT